MPVVFSRDYAPGHLFAIRELDCSDDLFTECVNGPWFRLDAIPRQEDLQDP